MSRSSRRRGGFAQAVRGAAILPMLWGLASACGSSPVSPPPPPPPSHDFWTRRAPMPSPRRSFGIGVVRDTIYIVGGYDLSGALVPDVEAYVPASDRWIAMPPLPAARGDLGVGVINGILYAIGGRETGTGITNAVEAYDPSTRTWSTRAPMPTRRRNAGVAVLDGLIYVAGGDTGATSTALDALEVYDPVADAWISRQSMAPTRTLAGFGAAAGVVSVIGGLTSTSGDSAVYLVNSYHPATDNWTIAFAMPGLGQYGTGVTELGGLLYVIGGVNTDTLFYENIESWDPAQAGNSWRILAHPSQGRAFLGAASVQGKVYAIGGLFGPNTVATNEEYTP